jgi:DNA-binding GntR family transcriptional regulator
MRLIRKNQKGASGSSLVLHREVLDAVIAHSPDRAEKVIQQLIYGARNDIEEVLASHRRLPSLNQPAPLMRTS